MSKTTQSLTIQLIPPEITEAIASHLDICSLMNLMDTCTQFRYQFLASTFIWRRVVFDLRYGDLSAIYAALRRLRDSNGLRQLVREVVMDGTDDSMFSPLVMLVKFPNMRRLCARNRRFNTKLKQDTKALLDMIKAGTIGWNTFELEAIEIYHHYMTTEPYLQVFQKTLQRLSRHPSVSIDIRMCGDESEKDNKGKLKYQLIYPLCISRLPIATDDILDQPSQACQRIVSKTAKCWACNHHFRKCWMCAPICGGCNSRRLPPMVNDQKKQQNIINQRLVQQINAQRQQEPIEEFSVFE
ncbi:hypothetical protein CLU79DRAFT_716317 [Phycomyces nitens]|nr:hypothetical protein CLU79DRAFT_716317 [Phycomyces nitens]